MTKEQLIQKVYRCIDEVYPNTDVNSPDVEEFNIPAFLDEAVRWVVKSVPVSALGDGDDNNFELSIPEGFLRMILLKMKGWRVPVMDALDTDNPRYWQQQNPALRAGKSRPVVFLDYAGCEFDPYPRGEGISDEFPKGEIERINIFKMDKGEDGLYTEEAYETYPDKLLDITAWKTAELIFSVMQDANGVAVAQAQITSITPTL